MSKYKIENGIYTTLVFHGNTMCIIERKPIQDVEAPLLPLLLDYLDLKPYNAQLDRPFVLGTDKAAIKGCSLDFVNVPFRNELILRN